MDFKLKYLKYKAKYFKLLEQTGSSNSQQVPQPSSPVSNFQPVIFSAGLSYVTYQNGSKINNDVILYAKINSVYKPAGTLGQIKNNGTFSTNVIVFIDGVRTVLGTVDTVQLYYDTNLQPVVEQPSSTIRPPSQPIVEQHLPPVPPEVQNNFSFVADAHLREMLTSAFAAIDRIPGGWGSLIPEPERGFMFTRHENPVLKQVLNEVVRSYPGHSGDSYRLVMRHMQGIARLGWDIWSQLYLNSQNIRPNNQASNVPLVDSEPVYCVLENDEFCPICFEPLGSSTHAVSDGTHTGTREDPISCGHKYHIKCIDEWIKTGRRDCPMCRGPITKLYPNTRK